MQKILLLYFFVSIWTTIIKFMSIYKVLLAKQTQADKQKQSGTQIFLRLRLARTLKNFDKSLQE